MGRTRTEELRESIAALDLPRDFNDLTRRAHAAKHAEKCGACAGLALDGNVVICNQQTDMPWWHQAVYAAGACVSACLAVGSFIILDGVLAYIPTSACLLAVFLWGRAKRIRVERTWDESGNVWYGTVYCTFHNLFAPFWLGHRPVALLAHKVRRHWWPRLTGWFARKFRRCPSCEPWRGKPWMMARDVVQGMGLYGSLGAAMWSVPLFFSGRVRDPEAALYVFFGSAIAAVAAVAMGVHTLFGYRREPITMLLWRLVRTLSHRHDGDRAADSADCTPEQLRERVIAYCRETFVTDVRQRFLGDASAIEELRRETQSFLDTAAQQLTEYADHEEDGALPEWLRAPHAAVQAFRDEVQRCRAEIEASRSAIAAQLQELDDRLQGMDTRMRQLALAERSAALVRDGADHAAYVRATLDTLTEDFAACIVRVDRVVRDAFAETNDALAGTAATEDDRDAFARIERAVQLLREGTQQHLPAAQHPAARTATAQTT
ncbi:MAG: hypothetical protein Q7T01_00215 [bacterium]|nr:hypothetical protein [bacterium]